MCLTSSMGLWKQSTTNPQFSINCKIDSKCKCGDSSLSLDQCSKFQAVRAFATLGMLAACVAALTQLYFVFKSKRVALLVLVFSIAAVLCGVIAMSIFDSFKKTTNSAAFKDYDYGWGFSLEVVAWIFVVISICIFHYGNRSHGDTSYSTLP